MHLYGLIIGISLYIGIWYFTKHQKLLTPDKINFLIAGTIISALVGARTYHILDYWHYYSQNMIQIPQTWNGGLGIFGGIIGGVLFITLYCYFQKINFFSLLDKITPILPLCQSIGRIGNWVNKENPVWWVESLSNLVLFLVIQKFPQNPTSKYLIGYGTIRLLTEIFRHDTWQISTIKIANIISIIFIVTGIFLWKTKTKKLA